MLTQEDKKHRVFIERFPAASAMQVSHQFKQEYEEETFRHACVLLVAYKHDDFDACALLASQVPGCASKIQHIRIQAHSHLWFFNDSTYDEEKWFQGQSGTDSCVPHSTRR